MSHSKKLPPPPLALKQTEIDAASYLYPHPSGALKLWLIGRLAGSWKEPEMPSALALFAYDRPYRCVYSSSAGTGALLSLGPSRATMILGD